MTNISFYKPVTYYTIFMKLFRFALGKTHKHLKYNCLRGENLAKLLQYFFLLLVLS